MVSNSTTQPTQAKPSDWTDTYTVHLWGTSTTFTRIVDGDGGATVTVDCDEPSVLLLAKKGDTDYWGGARKPRWSRNNKERRAWTR